MASSRIVCRLSFRTQPLAQKLNKKKTSLSSLLSPLKSTSQSTMRINRYSRLPLELSTMVPLHSAIASARMISSLSVESKSWGLVPQGISMPL